MIPGFVARMDALLQQDPKLARAMAGLGPAAGGTGWPEAERDARAAVRAAAWRLAGQMLREAIGRLAATLRPGTAMRRAGA